MSTRIYRGFHLDETYMHRVKLTIDGFRRYIQTQEQKMLDAFRAGCLTPEERLESWHNWCDRRNAVARNKTRDPAVDTEFGLVLFPFKGRFLGIAYTEHEAWFKKWLKQPGVSEYRYWNGTDKPTNIRASAWKQRALDWDQVLPGHTIPAEHGFYIQVHSTLGPVPRTSHKRPRLIKL